MEKIASETTASISDTITDTTTGPARFERPSIEEISLCCEISAYAPDDDDRPLF